MTDFIDIDFSDINQLAADLGKVPDNAGRKIRQAVEITARNVKKTWADKLKGEPGLPHGSRSITYDLSSTQAFGVSVLKAEIGAERGRMQAPIVVVNEFGAPGNNSAPRGYGAGALIENAPDLEEGLLIATAEAERQAGIDSSFTGSLGAVLRGSY